MSCLGNEGIEVVEILDRLILCAQGAIHLQDAASLFLYLKTSHNYLQMGFLTLEKKLRDNSVITRGFRSELDALFLISSAEEVMSRFTVNDLNYHLTEFSIYMKLFLNVSCRHEGVNATKRVMIYCCITFKYIEFCLPVDILNDQSIICLDATSHHDICNRFEYLYMDACIYNSSN
jgi:hypothetical protein